jgi:molecular chaperone DnaK
MAILGIDLGTTTTVVARLNEVGKPQILMNWENMPFTFSSVEFAADGEGVPVIGQDDQARNEVNPLSFREYKRNMGTDHAYQVGSRRYTAADLSALMLRRQREHILNELSYIERLVITTPANFGQKARQDTLAAAAAAGLPVPELVAEPTAAALFYIESAAVPLDGLCVVFDFGGGTLDVSLVEVRGRQVKVKGSKGVAKLGGMDLDRALLGLLFRKFEKEHGSLRQGDSDLNEYLARNTKHRLTESDRASVVIFSTQYGRRKVEVTRLEFEEVARPLVAQALDCCSQLLAEAGVRPAQVQNVFLAGGSSLVPVVRSSVEALFNRKPECRQPHQAIALGAVVFAAAMVARDAPEVLTPTQRDAIQTLRVQDVSPKCLGMLVTGLDGREVNELLVSKNQPIPCSVSRQFGVAIDGQRRVEFALTQSEEPSSDPMKVEVVTTAYLDLPRGAKAGQRVEVRFSYDLGGLIVAKFTDLTSGNITECQLEGRDVSVDGN